MRSWILVSQKDSMILSAMSAVRGSGVTGDPDCWDRAVGDAEAEAKLRSTEAEDTDVGDRLRSEAGA